MPVAGLIPSGMRSQDGSPRDEERCALARNRPTEQLASHLSFAGLVVLAGSLNPIPSRTRPLNSPAPMVLSLKAWKSRSLPGLPRTDKPHHDDEYENPPRFPRRVFLLRIFAFPRATRIP